MKIEEGLEVTLYDNCFGEGRNEYTRVIRGPVDIPNLNIIDFPVNLLSSLVIKDTAGRPELSDSSTVKYC